MCLTRSEGAWPGSNGALGVDGNAAGRIEREAQAVKNVAPVASMARKKARRARTGGTEKL